MQTLCNQPKASYSLAMKTSARSLFMLALVMTLLILLGLELVTSSAFYVELEHAAGEAHAH